MTTLSNEDIASLPEYRDRLAVLIERIGNGWECKVNARQKGIDLHLTFDAGAVDVIDTAVPLANVATDAPFLLLKLLNHIIGTETETP